MDAVSETTFVHKMPKGYEAQDGCWNCYWCFIRAETDEFNRYYCRRKAPKRPKCGSGAMDECYPMKGRWADHKEAFIAASRLWDEWANGRQVAPWGKCEKHRWRERVAEYVEHITDNLPRPTRKEK